MDFNIGTYGLLGLAYTVLIVLVLRQRTKNQAGFGLFLAFMIFLWAAAIFRVLPGLGISWSIRASTLGLIPYYLGIVISLFLLEITFGFLHMRPDRWYWWVINSVWLVGVVFVNENINGYLLDDFMVGSFLINRPALGVGLLIASWAVYSLRTGLLTITNYHKTAHPLHRNRDVFWFLSIILNLTGVILSVTPYFILPVGEIIIFVSVAMMGYFFFTHDLPDIRRSIRRSVSLLFSAVLSVAIYALFFFYLQSYLKTYQKDVDAIILAVALAAVITLLLHPLTRLIQRFVNRLILESGYDPSRLLGEYSKKISNIIDLTSLADIITKTIMTGLNVRRARLFLVDQKDRSYYLAEVNPGPMPGDTSQLYLNQDSPVAEYLQNEHRPLAQYDIDLLPQFRKLPVEEITELKNLAIDLYVSIFYQGRWIGLLGLGTKKSGDRYYAKELTFLETVADQTGVALENARLYEDLKIRNAENERLNQELVGANQELSRLDKAKSDFINIASHELRTPLTKIIGYNDMLEDMIKNNAASPTASGQMMEEIRKAARRLEEIVNMMFDVSKLDTSTLELSMSPVSPATIIEGSIDRWKGSLESRKLSLTVQGIVGLPILQADGKRLIQVFSQLIQNAIKFTPDGGKITVSGRLIEEEITGDKQVIEIVVADTGIGIASDELERIFDRFYRVGDVMLHSTGDFKFKGAGTGLGLTICRGIVEAHGGKVWAESPGYDEKTFPGSSFHVQIPVCPPTVQNI